MLSTNPYHNIKQVVCFVGYSGGGPPARGSKGIRYQSGIKERKRKEKEKKEEKTGSQYSSMESLLPPCFPDTLESVDLVDQFWQGRLFIIFGNTRYLGNHYAILYCARVQYWTRTSASTRNKSRRERLSNSSTCYWCVAFFSLFFFLLFSFPFLPLLFLSPSIHIRCLAVYSGWENWYNKLRLMNMQFRSIIGNTMNFPNVGFFLLVLV